MFDSLRLSLSLFKGFADDFCSVVEDMQDDLACRLRVFRVPKDSAFIIPALFGHTCDQGAMTSSIHSMAERSNACAISHRSNNDSCGSIAKPS